MNFQRTVALIMSLFVFHGILDADEKSQAQNLGFENIPCGQYNTLVPEGDGKNHPLKDLGQWELKGTGVVKIVEDEEAPEGKKYLLFESFSPFFQRKIKTVLGQKYQIYFRAREIRNGEKMLAVYWNDSKLDQFGTKEWQEYSVTVTGTGDDILKFQRIGKTKPSLDAIVIKELK